MLLCWWNPLGVLQRGSVASVALLDYQPCAASAGADLRDDSAQVSARSTEQSSMILVFEVAFAFAQWFSSPMSC
jgi:hypothetical protein